MGCEHKPKAKKNKKQFQSTHPCGVRTKAMKTKDEIIVSIHAPVWGAKLQNLHVQNDETFQSTHPCGVRMTRLKPLLSVIWVSIHAPVWGANMVEPQDSDKRGVSIHAPVWGAKWGRMVDAMSEVSFNPRTRVGCET